MAKQQPPTAATPMMAQAGLSFTDLTTYAREVVDLLQTTGATFIDLAEQGFKLWNAISSRDLSAVLAAFAAGRNDVEVIIAAVTLEFGL